MPRKARPIVISPQTRARDLRDIDGVILNRGEFCRQFGGPPPVEDRMMSTVMSSSFEPRALGNVANILANTDTTRWKVPLTLEVPLLTKLEEA